ncbi:3-dehydrosphinganine reductase [Martiniozyma asiatica (nom. inval.)]|nr:3-dehydrosphinganine reductase [Martiniozyma asiatica]
MESKLFIISGASQGLGLSIANKVHDKGANVIILARSADKLKLIVESHKKDKKRPNQFTISYPIDLTKENEIVIFKEWLIENEYIPDNIICCAGSSIPKLFSDLTLEELRQGLNLNYLTAAYLLHSTLPIMEKSFKNDKINRKAIIISSSVAFYPFIGYSQYNPSKAALKSLADTLQHEFGNRGINIHTVYPGNFDSPGYKEENLTKPEITKEIEGGSIAISVDTCAEIILNDIFTNGFKKFFWPNGKRYIFTDLLGWLMFTFSMGFSARDFFGIEILFAIIGSIIARFIDIWHVYLIGKWFAKKERNDKSN